MVNRQMKTGSSCPLRTAISCTLLFSIFLIPRDRDSARALFEKYKPDYVIHLAAKVGGLFNNMAHKVEFYNDNIIMNMNVMEMCREFKVVMHIKYKL